MLIVNSFYRLIDYLKRHGVRATFDRAEIALRRLYSAGRMVIYYYDFPMSGLPVAFDSLPPGLTVERKNSQEELAPRDLDRIVNFWSPELAKRNLAERFSVGASLWIARWNEEVAGYGWTLRGHTMRAYFIPLGPEDVHLFDFLVFPEYRGRRVNPALVSHILQTLAKEKRSRVYIEVAEWNEAELNSLKRTRFRSLGRARKTSLFGRTIVEWRTESEQNAHSKTEQKIS